MVEQWKEIKNYPGYLVSSWGRIKSYKRSTNGKIIFGKLDKDGYRKVLLYSAPGIRKTFSVHRLVAQSFLSNPHNYPVVNHKDENKLNNHVSNLEWCCIGYNNRYGNRQRKAKETLKDNNSKYVGISIVAYKNGKYKYFNNYCQAAKQLHVSLGDISLLVNNKGSIKRLKAVKGWQIVKKGEESKIDYTYTPIHQVSKKFKAMKNGHSQIFNSKSEASKILGIDSSYICKCLKYGYKGKGYTFKYIE